MENATLRIWRAGILWKWISAGLGVLGLLILGRVLPLGAWLEVFSDWVGDLGVAGMAIYGGVYVLATVLFLPGAILTAGAGFVFGVAQGLLVVSISATTGAALAFLIARYVARDRIAALAAKNERFRAIDSAIGSEGWKIVGLLRLSPAVPFNLSNYLYGLTAVRFWPYVLASWLGMLPGTLLYVYLGAAGKTGLQAATGDQPAHSSMEYGLFGVGLLATVIATIMVTRIARKALKPRKNTPPA